MTYPPQLFVIVPTQGKQLPAAWQLFRPFGYSGPSPKGARFQCSGGKCCAGCGAAADAIDWLGKIEGRTSAFSGAAAVNEMIEWLRLQWRPVLKATRSSGNLSMLLVARLPLDPQ
jgi:hypothetical protein